MVHGVGNLRVVASAAVLCTICGCSSRLPVGEVEGVVKLGDKPLPNVRVQFMPDPEKGTKGPISAATTDEQGRFKLVCADERAGAVVGHHRVVVTDLSARLYKTPAHGDDDKTAPKQKTQQPRVPDKYTTVTQTPLLVEVKAGKQEVTLDLTR
jgi:hypothetical protein